MAASLDARKAHAAARWSALADLLQTITPETIARLAIGTVALAVVGWLSVVSWPALAPFVAGLVIAYAVLPIANRLDRLMPRVLAALVAELVAVGILGAVGVLVVPPLVRSLTAVAGMLPTGEQVRAGIDNLQTWLGGLQEPVRGIVLAVATQVSANLQSALDGVVNGAAAFVTEQILGLAGTASFVLGLLVIPAWILTMVSDDRVFRRRAVGVIAPALRPDVIALARIADRAFATFLRVRVILAITTSVLVWLGLEAAGSLGVGNYQYAVGGATLLGVLQLIPELGFFLGFIPILLVLVVQGPAEALVAAAVYWGAVKLASTLVENRLSGRVLDVHPALLIPGVVVLSQFGLVWTLAAAPLLAIGRDTVRYLAGRLGDPPRPAGVLPGDRAANPAARPAAPVPSVYRSVAVRTGPARPALPASSARAAAAPATPAASMTSAAPAPSVAPARVNPTTALPQPAFTPSSPAAEPLALPTIERSIVS